MNKTLSFDPRRRWLLRSGASCASALGFGSVGNLLLGTQQAHAADYKALVCVFLYGGNDGLNTVVPTDAARHAQYSAVRGALALPRASLLALPGTEFGLHPSLAALSGAASAGHMAPVFNVGPLYAPLSKAQFRSTPNGAALRPDGLFSHSDQQVLWESGTTRSQERTGWGGRASTSLGTANPVISVGGNARFGLTDLQSPLVLPGPGSTFGAYGLQPADLSWAPRIARKAAIDVMYNQTQDTVLADAYARMQRDAFAVSQRLGALVKVEPGSSGANPAIDAAFAAITSGGRITTALGRQLYQVAKLIAGNATVGGDRQIFFAQAGGFDTHAGQVAGGATGGEHARRLQEVGDALGAFYTAMRNLGLGQAVTTFTQSDFGAHLQAQQQQRHRPRLGQSAPGDRRCGAGAHHLRQLPTAGAGGRRRRRQRPVGAARPVDSDHLGRPVRGDLARLVRCQRCTARCDLAEPAQLRHAPAAGFRLTGLLGASLAEAAAMAPRSASRRVPSGPSVRPRGRVPSGARTGVQLATAR